MTAASRMLPSRYDSEGDETRFYEIDMIEPFQISSSTARSFRARGSRNLPRAASPSGGLRARMVFLGTPLGFDGADGASDSAQIPVGTPQPRSRLAPARRLEAGRCDPQLNRISNIGGLGGWTAHRWIPPSARWATVPTSSPAVPSQPPCSSVSCMNATPILHTPITHTAAHHFEAVVSRSD